MQGLEPPEQPVVVIFGSIHRVLKAERALKEAGVPVDLITTPRDLSSDCGMVARIRRGDLCRVLALLKAGGIGFQKIAAETGGGHEEIAVPSSDGPAAPKRKEA